MAPCSQIVVYAPCERMHASLEDPSKIDGQRGRVRLAKSDAERANVIAIRCTFP